MKHIKQKSTVDCVIACLAMVTGFTYDEILEKIPFSPFKEFEVVAGGQVNRFPYSFMADEIPVFLALLGLPHLCLHTTNFFKAFGVPNMQPRVNNGLLPSSIECMSLLKNLGVQAILLIEPWIDEFVEHHAVVYDPEFQKIFDPHPDHLHNGGLYELEEVLIYQIIIVPIRNNVSIVDEAISRELANAINYIGYE